MNVDMNVDVDRGKYNRVVRFISFLTTISLLQTEYDDLNKANTVTKNLRQLQVAGH